uniref:Kringle domain-containing protein n=1 Tax=Macrostomum lignano TaxID=282301 RepID=A0A1I8F2K2_9PLAT
DSDCFFHTGAMYTGTVHHVRSGKPCLHWSSFQTELVSMGLTKSKLRLFLATNPRNYCRNPLSELEHTMFANSRLKPWCFVNKISYEMRMLWDYCEIKRCGSSHYHTASWSLTRTDLTTSDMNAEACFETCRFRCEKFALMNLRRHTPTRNLRACQCFNESEIPDPAADFKGRYIDNLPVMFDHRVYLYYNIYFKYHQSDGPFRYLKWEPCLLFDTMFRCPLVNIDGAPELFTTVFEIALPKNCYEANRMIHWEQLDTMTIFGAMGNFRQVASINQVTSKVLMSSRNSHSRFLNTLCTHQTTAFTYCPPFEAESLLDPNSYFNNVVDEDFQWIIFDIGSHKHISLLKLFINRMDLSAMRFLEVFVRGAPLPHWLVETDFRSSDGEKGRRTEYFRRATMAEKMLWASRRSRRCSRRRTAQFTLPLTTHDSVHPDERFLQEDWDVEACGDWEIMKDTTIVGVPSKLKLTISEEHPRGQSCYEWKEALGPIKDSSCKRAVYFRVDNDTGEVIHYPDFGRSYGLAVDMQNCQFCLRRFQGMQSFRILAEFLLPAAFHQLQSEHDVRVRERHRLWQKVRHHDHFEPVHVNNPYHPYYRMLQDLLEETGFFRVPAANRTTKPRSVPPRADPGSAASSIPHHIAAILGGSSAAKSKPRNAAQKQRQQVGPSQVSDPQPAAPAAAPQA